jgi:hypothetical protein
MGRVAVPGQFGFFANSLPGPTAQGFATTVPTADGPMMFTYGGMSKRLQIAAQLLATQDWFKEDWDKGAETYVNPRVNDEAIAMAVQAASKLIALCDLVDQRAAPQPEDAEPEEAESPIVLARS